MLGCLIQMVPQSYFIRDTAASNKQPKLSGIDKFKRFNGGNTLGDAMKNRTQDIRNLVGGSLGYRKNIH